MRDAAPVLRWFLFVPVALGSMMLCGGLGALIAASAEVSKGQASVFLAIVSLASGCIGVSATVALLPTQRRLAAVLSGGVITLAAILSWGFLPPGSGLEPGTAAGMTAAAVGAIATTISTCRGA